MSENQRQSLWDAGRPLWAGKPLELTFGTAAWKTKSVISASVELEAWMVMTAMLGLGFALSKVKSIFRPFLLYAVIGGIPMKVNPPQKTTALDFNLLKGHRKTHGCLECLDPVRQGCGPAGFCVPPPLLPGRTQNPAGAGALRTGSGPPDPDSHQQRYH